MNRISLSGVPGAAFGSVASVWLLLFALSHVVTAAEPEVVITDPVRVAQYDDAIVMYFHGFDVARIRFPDLELSYRLIGADGTLGDEVTVELGQEWEKPGIILRKDNTEYAAIVITAGSGANVFFRRLYPFSGTLDPQTQIATLAQNAVIEPGQFLEGAPPTIAQPDLSALDLVTIGAAPRSVDMGANSYQAKSDINYPLVDAGNNGPLSLQTDFPTDLSKRSLYVVLKFQLYDQVTGDPGETRRVLCEVPLNADWLNGTEDLVVNLEADDIKVHATDQQFEGVHILPRGRGGLGQATGTMARGADYKIYWTGVPSQIVRFDPVTAEWELPPTSVKDLMYDDRPTREEVLGETGNTNKIGHYGSYRMIWSMNHITPTRMVFSSVQNRRFNHGFFWGGMWTVPQDHWDDPVAFAANFHFPVAAWPTAPHDFWDVLPTIGGPNYRLWQFPTFGNSIYVRPYPNSVGGPWRVDLNPDGSVEAFGTEASGVFPDFDDYRDKPADPTPHNAAGKITFTNYGVLNMSRIKLKEALTGIRDLSLSGDVEVNYDAIEHMLQTPAAYTEILDNIGGPSLAPGYMATHIPGQDGQVLGAAEYGYYISQLDMNTTTPGEVEKTYLRLDSADPTLELPLKVGLGPYGHQWCNINGDDWLYVGGYIGMTRFQYSSNGVPLQRFSMDKFDTRLATTYLDGANAIAGGAIKRYRYMQHGIDDLMFVTGTHTAARGGTAFSGGLMSFHKTQLDRRWKLSYMSRCYNTVRLRNRVIRENDGSLLQEFCHTGWFNSDYVHTIPSAHVPANRDAKIFCYDYPAGGTMRDRMGFSVAGLNGGTPSLIDVAYSRDRRYLVVRQESDRLLTFDPQTRRYIDGVQITLGAGFYEAEMNRPGHRLLRAPDDRLFLYGAASNTDSNAKWIEVQVSPTGELSLLAHTELQFASSDDRQETFDSTHTFLPDYANDDGSYDLWLGQNYSNPDTDCRLIEDFIPPRRHDPTRSLNLLSSGANGIPIQGSKPGVTPYRADCADSESITLTATDPLGLAFQEWQDGDGNVLGADSTLQLNMDEDRIVVAVYGPAPIVTNLVVSELHYHPSAPSGDELLAGYTSPDQFEFLELMNTGDTDYDLSGVSFVEGIAFDFSTGPIQVLGAGERILLVSNLGAFTERYGSDQLAKIAGTFNGNLSDDGALLKVMDGSAEILSFTYDDQAPWPEGADGGGLSLVLLDPTRQPPPDHSNPGNWRGSRTVGGSPGLADTATFAGWATGFGIVDLSPGVDSDGDGRSDLLEYLQGTDPLVPDDAYGLTSTIESLEVEGITAPYFVFRVLHQVGVEDVDILFEQSTDIDEWAPLDAVYMDRERDGTSPVEWLIFRSAIPAVGFSEFFARLRAQLR